MQDGISVIVCCYNSAERLPATLDHLAKQQMDDLLEWEIIVVDNASSDNTSTVAQSIWTAYTGVATLSIITEPIPGLANARRAGIAAARFEYIVLCDDDNWLGAGYVQTIANILSNNKNIGVVGGWSDPVSDVPIPFWFNEYRPFYAVGTQALYSGDVKERNFVYGAGMGLRKSVYKKLLNAGFPSLLSDRTGDSLVSGGDVEICYMHRLAGLLIWYDERLYFRHYMPGKRLEKTYLEKLEAGALTGVKLLQPYYPLLAKKKTGGLKSFVLTLYHLLRSGVAAVISGKDPHYHLSYAEAYNSLPITFHKDVRRIKKAMRVKL